MTKLDLIPLNDLSRWDDGEKQSIKKVIADVIESGVFIDGPKNGVLSEQLKDLLSGRHIVCVGNGTDALVLSLLGLGVQSGDIVATVANAGGYATSAILRIGAVPLLIDIDLTTAQMSSSDLQNKFLETPNVKAVVVTHLYGLVADIEAIRDVADKHSVLLIEDCAQSIGAVKSGVPAGAFGDASTFSFYPTKNLGALGDGGAVAFKNQEHASLVKKLAQYVWSTRYTVSHERGINSRLDEIQAAIIVERFKTWKQKNKSRQTIVKKYQLAVKSPRRIIFADDDSFVGHMAVLVSPTRDRDRSAFENAGIATGVHFPVLDHQQGAWKHHFDSVTLPNSEKLVEQIISIPCFTQLHETEIERICSVLKDL